MLAHVVESDAQLVARCRAGDEDAWRELVERFSRYVYAISVQAYRMSESDAAIAAARASRSRSSSTSIPVASWIASRSVTRR